MALDSSPDSVSVGEEDSKRVKYSDLPLAVQNLIDDIRHGHRANKREKLTSQNNSQGVKTALREKYAALIEKIGDCLQPTSQGYTHFRITRGGDVVFVQNNTHYGQAFKRLWSLHLPLF